LKGEQKIYATDAIIIDYQGSIDKLSRDQEPGVPSIPMQVGNVMELNDQRAKVVGICNITRTFQSQRLFIQL